jgi:hypothetical protein
MSFRPEDMPASYQVDNLTEEEAEAALLECVRTFRYPPVESVVEAPVVAANVAALAVVPKVEDTQLPNYDDGDDPVEYLLATSFDRFGNRRPDPPRARGFARPRRETKRQLNRRLAEEAVARGKLKDALTK